jgi:superfamily II DNA/RNA helicase
MLRVCAVLQAACIPLALAGRDICGSAMTGSGKTAAFALPILERLLFRPRQVAATYVLILAPTRELAAQVIDGAAWWGLAAVTLHARVRVCCRTVCSDEHVRRLATAAARRFTAWCRGCRSSLTWTQL